MSTSLNKKLKYKLNLKKSTEDRYSLNGGLKMYSGFVLIRYGKIDMEMAVINEEVFTLTDY